MSALRSEPDIRLNWFLRAAFDPKRTRARPILCKAACGTSDNYYTF
jgi:hypothetical protein